MSISEAARKSHEKLLPSHTSTLAATDPEFIELFDNFAFDEVLSYGNLDDRTRMMTILATLIASQSLSEYKVMLGGGLNLGVTPVEAKEILYQAVPYCGIAKVFDFIHATNDVLISRGIKLPQEGQSTTSPETRLEKGLAAQKAIFGDYYTRAGLDLRTRELLTFSMILAVVTQLVPYLGYPRVLNAIRCLNEVIPGV